jgi:hypothetical protein
MQIAAVSYTKACTLCWCTHSLVCKGLHRKHALTSVVCIAGFHDRTQRHGNDTPAVATLPATTTTTTAAAAAIATKTNVASTTSFPATTKPRTKFSSSQPQHVISEFVFLHLNVDFFSTVPILF